MFSPFLARSHFAPAMRLLGLVAPGPVGYGLAQRLPALCSLLNEVKESFRSHYRRTAPRTLQLLVLYGLRPWQRGWWLNELEKRLYPKVALSVNRVRRRVLNVEQR